MGRRNAEQTTETDGATPPVKPKRAPKRYHVVTSGSGAAWVIDMSSPRVHPDAPQCTFPVKRACQTEREARKFAAALELVGE